MRFYSVEKHGKALFLTRKGKLCRRRELKYFKIFAETENIWIDTAETPNIYIYYLANYFSKGKPAHTIWTGRPPETTNQFKHKNLQTSPKATTPKK